MNPDLGRRPVGRRRLLGALGVAGGLLAVRSRGAPEGPLAAAQAGTPAASPAASPAAEWTPPPIPKPLPTPGGTPPPLVGAAPTQSAAPPSSVQNPEAAATPGAAEQAGAGEQAPVVQPGEPAQPIASPAATPAAAPTPEPSATVELTPDFAFDPAKVTIETGQAVRWVNRGRSPQTVTCDPARVAAASQVSLPDGAQPWDSGVLNSGDDFVHVFEVAGTYRYVSMTGQPKPMTGEVDVQG